MSATELAMLMGEYLGDLKKDNPELNPVNQYHLVKFLEWLQVNNKLEK